MFNRVLMTPVGLILKTKKIYFSIKQLELCTKIEAKTTHFIYQRTNWRTAESVRHEALFNYWGTGIIIEES